MDELKQNLRGFIEEFSTEIGPRTPCSAGKQKGALLFSTKLQALSKETVVEQFSAVPMAYKMGFRLPQFYIYAHYCFLISCLGSVLF